MSAADRDQYKPVLRPADLWVLRRSVTGHALNGELCVVSERFRPLAEHLDTIDKGERQTALDGFLCGCLDAAAIVTGMASADPDGPAPAEDDEVRFATVADVRRTLAETRWTWDGWIPAGRVFGLAGFEGTGKTRTAMDIHRRAFFGLPAPDGQRFALEPGRPAIWLCSDGHQDELAELLPAFGLPDESVVFPSLPDEPYEGTDIDAPELIAPGGLLDRAIASVKPWCVFVDTLTNATSRNLCDQHVMKGLKVPMVRLAQTYGVNVGLMLHLSREGQALGRRVKGITRTLLHLEASDPEGQPHRLKFWVEKSYAKKPPVMGVTLGADGNTYDFSPPKKPDPNLGGRPADARDKARQFITEALTLRNDQRASALCAGWEDAGNDKSAFWRARDVMVGVGEITCDGKPLVMHLNHVDIPDDGTGSF